MNIERMKWIITEYERLKEIEAKYKKWYGLIDEKVKITITPLDLPEELKQYIKQYFVWLSIDEIRDKICKQLDKLRQQIAELESET